MDLALFRPHRDEDGPREDFSLPRPVFLYVGRVAVEKNIRAFLDLDLPGSKVVVGDGPQLPALRREYPRVQFLGARFGEALARAYAGADAFVFPSLTDTFGLVMLEALACGTPVAAFPVTGPLDVLGAAPGAIGAIDTDLRRAALTALEAIGRRAGRMRSGIRGGRVRRDFWGNWCRLESRRAGTVEDGASTMTSGEPGKRTLELGRSGRNSGTRRCQLRRRRRIQAQPLPSMPQTSSASAWSRVSTA